MIPACGVLAVLAAVFQQIGLDGPFGRNLLSLATFATLGAVTIIGWRSANRLAALKRSQR
jgi:hypothetical protein